MISWCCKYSNGNTVAPLSPAGRQQHFLFKKNSRSPMQEHQIPFKNTKHTGCYAQLISIFTPSPCLTTTLCPYSDFLTGLGSLKISSNSSRPFLRLEHSSPHSQPLQEMEDREDGVSLHPMFFNATGVAYVLIKLAKPDTKPWKAMPSARISLLSTSAG
jgi:hypothetical protein